jgi:hypothetical protein
VIGACQFWRVVSHLFKRSDESSLHCAAAMAGRIDGTASGVLARASSGLVDDVIFIIFHDPLHRWTPTS